MNNLRAALEAARAEYNATENLNHGPVCERASHIYERHVLAWLREKAGEEVTIAIQGALQEWHRVCDPDAEPAPMPVDLRSILHHHLLPLFVALRAEIEKSEEELEAEVEDHYKLTRMQIERTLPAMRAWQAEKGKPSNLYPDLGELVEWLMTTAHLAKQQTVEDAVDDAEAALRKIVKEKEGNSGNQG